MAALFASLIVRRTPSCVRYYMQFAALLYLTFALATFGAVVLPGPATDGVAATGSALICALAPACLAIAVFASFGHRPHASIVAITLLIACLCGLFGAVSGIHAPAFAVLFVSVCAMLTLALRRSRHDWRAAADVGVASLCLIAGVASTMIREESGAVALALFSAAGLLGIALGISRQSGALVENDRDVLVLDPIDLRR